MDFNEIVKNGHIDNYEIDGNRNVKIKDFASISSATQHDLTFCSSEKKGVSMILNSNAGIILCLKSLTGKIKPKDNQLLIFVEDPRNAFVRVIREIRCKQKPITNISNNAIIKSKSPLGSNCFIGDYSVLGENCMVGNNCIIKTNCFLDNCEIGNNCIIESNVTIGNDGFGFERDNKKEIVRFPHLKKVIIEENVEIGSNSSIDRGTLDNTIIGYGTKIDSKVQIGHNVKIGKKCFITAGSTFGGSVITGESCYFGLNCAIKNGIRIGSNVIVGVGSVILNDVKNFDVVAGVPAKSIKEKVSLKNDLFLKSFL